MASWQPHYELTVYKPRSEDPTETQVLTQLGNPGETFVVSTDPSHARPYLKRPEGRRGRINLPKRGVDGSSITVRLLDVRTSGSADSLARWVTAFLGDSEGRNRLLGCKIRIREETTDGGAYEDYFTGRIETTELDDSKLWLTLTLRDLVKELETEIFVGPGHGSLSYVHPTCYLPHGRVGVDYGGLSTVEPLTGTARTSKILDIDRKEWKAWRTIVTQAFQEVLFDPGSLGPTPFSNTHVVIIKSCRVHVKITSGARTGEEGDFWLAKVFRNKAGWKHFGYPIQAVDAIKDNAERLRVTAVGIYPLEVTDPLYMAPPSGGEAVEIKVYNYGPPTKGAPTLITDVHPAALTRDILDGKLGPLVETAQDGTIGDPVITFPYLATDFVDGGAGLVNDTSIPTVRFLIQEAPKAKDFLEELNLQTQLGYRIDESGRYRPIDWRLSSADVGSLLTIGSEDVAQGADSVRWEQSRASAVTRVEVTFYSDRTIASAHISRADGVPDITPLRTAEDKHQRIYLFDRFGELSERDLKIDATGIRFTATVTDPDGASPERIERRIRSIVSAFRSPFGNGGATLHLRARRTSNTNGCREGDLRKVQVRAQPDPATNLRGGPRLMRCIERTAEGLHLHLVFADEGSDAVATPPAVGAIAQNGSDANAIDVPLTLNAQGEPAVVEYAITGTSVGVRPAEDSPLWTHAGARKSAGTLVIPGVPRGKRIWIQARTEATESDAPKIPSAWAYPAAQYVDMEAIPAPTNLQATVSGRSIILTWTNGDTDMAVMPVIAATPATPAAALQEPLPPGSARVILDELLASEEYEVGVMHLDGYGGASVATTTTVTTSATGETLAAPSRIQILQGRTSAGREASLPEGLSMGFGLDVRVFPAEPEANLRVQVSTDSGFSGPEEELILDPGESRTPLLLERDSGAVRRYVRSRAERDGFTDSPWSPVVSAYPTELLPEAGPDLFPGGSAEARARADGKLEIKVSDGGDPSTDRAYYAFTVNPPNADDYPDVDETDEYIAKADMPYLGPADDGVGSPITVAEGDLVVGRILFWHPIAGFGQEVLFSFVVPVGSLVDCDPSLEAEAAKWNLKPRRTALAKSIKYLVTTDGSEPTAQDVRDTGTVTTLTDFLAHTSSAGGEKVKVGCLAYANDDGTGAEGPLRIARGTYIDDSDLPSTGLTLVAEWAPYPAGGIDKYIGLLKFGKGASIESAHVELTPPSSPVEEYDVNLAAEGTHIVRDSTLDDLDPSPYRVFTAGSDPFMIEVTPYDAANGAQGSGSPGKARRADLLPPTDEGKGMVFKDQTGALRIGSKTVARPFLDVGSDASNEPQLKLRALANKGFQSGSWSPNYNDGGRQKVSLSGPLTLGAVSNMLDGENMELIVITNGYAFGLSGSVYEGPTLSWGTGAASKILLTIMDTGEAKLAAMGGGW